MNNITSILIIVLAALIFIVIALIFTYLLAKKKEDGKEVAKESIKESENTSRKAQVSKTAQIAREYETKSIFDFMEFEAVQDNMIIQKNGKRFLMAVECQGVNYDLMSDIEKASTEDGFGNFLNTLKDPIQIYIQTRTVNLEKNIQVYKSRVDKIKSELDIDEYKLKQFMEKDPTNEKNIKDKKFDVLRKKNLYAYGKDIVADTQRMSLNKNVLRKKYYIIIKYFFDSAEEGIEEGTLSEEEIYDLAFGHLYTNASSMISALSGVGITGKILTSFELVELLYNAYNRDDSECFGIDKAVEAGYNEIYIDARSSIDKKIEALNKEIQQKAHEIAQNAIDEVVDERKKELEEIEENIDNIVEELAVRAIQNESARIPEEIREEAIKKIDRKKGEKNVKEKGTKKSRNTKSK